MGFLDRWLQRFLSDDAARTPEPAGANAAAPASSPASARAPQRGRAATVPTVAAADGPGADPLEALLARARGRLTLDEAGRRFAESPTFLADLARLDASGRSRAADALLADALVVSRGVALRRLLCERLLHRGERARALPLLRTLAADEAHAVYAWFTLAELAEGRGDRAEALACYERVLVSDFQHAVARSRAARLRPGATITGTDEREALTRLLGAKAAGSRYRVLEEVGRGGAATVFRALDRIAAREVALKIFHPRGHSVERRARIVREARIAGRFDHPHIVPILDVDEERELLVMSLCDGGSLRQRMGQGRMAVFDAADVGAVLLRTLRDVHDAGQVHLDIKPSNLLFHEARLMLSDFGVAGLIQLGAAAGTRAFMSPEQRRGEAAGPASDVYAAGLVLYECVEGRLPAGAELESGRLLLHSHPPGPRRRALEHLICALCHPQAAERPRDLLALADELLEAASLPGDDARGRGFFERLERLAAQQGPAAAAALAAHPLATHLRPGAGE